MARDLIINVKALQKDWPNMTGSELAKKYKCSITTLRRVNESTEKTYTVQARKIKAAKTRKANGKKTATVKAKAPKKKKDKPTTKVTNGTSITANGVTKHYGDEVALKAIRINVDPQFAFEFKAFCKVTDLDEIVVSRMIQRALQRMMDRHLDHTIDMSSKVDDLYQEIGKEIHSRRAKA